MKKGNENALTQDEINHNGNSEVDGGMVIQPLEGPNHSGNQCTIIHEPSSEPHEVVQQIRGNQKGQHNDHNGQLPTSNSYTVLFDFTIENQSSERTHDMILPIKALGAYLIQDHE